MTSKAKNNAIQNLERAISLLQYRPESVQRYVDQKDPAVKKILASARRSLRALEANANA